MSCNLNGYKLLTVRLVISSIYRLRLHPMNTHYNNLFPSSCHFKNTSTKLNDELWNYSMSIHFIYMQLLNQFVHLLLL